MMIRLTIILIAASLLFAGCYTTDNYSDTPENIISGKSVIIKNEGFVLEKVLLKSGKFVNLSNYFTAFMDCGKDTCGKLFYAYRDRICDTIPKTDSTPMRLRYREPAADTLNISDIRTMYYSRTTFDGGSAAFIAGVILIVPVLYLIVSSFSPHVGKY